MWFDPSLVFKGILIGISVSAPVGPVGILCIQRTLTRGRLNGLISGLGAATADFLYSLVAAFGLTFISSFMIDQSGWFTVFGAVLLCMLGVRTYQSQPVRKKADDGEKNLVHAYLSSLVLTISNPLTILLFMGIFAGLSSQSHNFTNMDSLILVFGVLAGASAWWLGLSTVVSIFRDKFNMKWLYLINKATGVVVGAIGIALILNMMLKLTVGFSII